MTLNNLPLISPLLPTAGDCFCHLQIIRRGKDHPNMPAANKLIKSYLVRDADHLTQIMPDVIFLCEHYKARAYISAQIKSIAKLNTLILRKLADNLHTGNIINPWHVFNSACGELQGVEKRWVIDVDDKDSDTLESIKNTVNKCQGKVDDKIITIIPTLNGYHLITHPFNVQEFNKQWPDVSVHKNPLTLLYMPSI